MIDATPYKFELYDGWPPDGEAGDFWGFDADMAPSVLRWRDGEWSGVRLTHYDGRGWMPEAFRRGKDTEGYVVKWARAPMRYSIAGGGG